MGLGPSSTSWQGARSTRLKIPWRVTTTARRAHVSPSQVCACPHGHRTGPCPCHLGAPYICSKNPFKVQSFFQLRVPVTSATSGSPGNGSGPAASPAEAASNEQYSPAPLHQYSSTLGLGINTGAPEEQSSEQDSAAPAAEAEATQGHGGSGTVPAGDPQSTSSVQPAIDVGDYDEPGSLDIDQWEVEEELGVEEEKSGGVVAQEASSHEATERMPPPMPASAPAPDPASGLADVGRGWGPGPAAGLPPDTGMVAVIRRGQPLAGAARGGPRVACPCRRVGGGRLGPHRGLRLCPSCCGGRR
eukprot:jgi/Botrbrau1/13239/Bobra.0199s0011.1